MKFPSLLVVPFLCLAPTAGVNTPGPSSAPEDFTSLGLAGELAGSAAWTFEFNPTPGVELTYMPLLPELGMQDFSKVGQPAQAVVRFGRSIHVQVDGASKHLWASRDLDLIPANETFIDPCQGFVPPAPSGDQAALIAEWVGARGLALAGPGIPLDLQGAVLHTYFGFCGQAPVLRAELR